MTIESKAGYAARWFDRASSRLRRDDHQVDAAPYLGAGNTWARLTTLSLELPRPLEITMYPIKQRRNRWTCKY